MKIWTILFALSLLAGCGLVKDLLERDYEGKLVERLGVWYVPTETEPFTGRVREYYSNGVVSKKAHYKDGKMTSYFLYGKDGKESEWRIFEWWDNGVLRADHHVKKNSVRESVRKEWHRNGERYQENALQGNKVHGRQSEWNANGEIVYEACYKRGIVSPLSYCDRVYEGELVERLGVSYVPTETEPFTGTAKYFCLPSRSCYKGEDVYEEGKQHGLAQTWHKNGKPASRNYWNEGKQHGLAESWPETGEFSIRSCYVDGLQSKKFKKVCQETPPEI